MQQENLESEPLLPQSEELLETESSPDIDEINWKERIIESKTLCSTH